MAAFTVNTCLSRSSKISRIVHSSWQCRCHPATRGYVTSWEVEGRPVITVPTNLTRKLKNEKNSRIVIPSLAGKLLIAAKRPHLNFYMGQDYNRFSPSNLVSQGWKSRRSLGDYFSINSFKKNPSLFNSQKSLGENWIASFSELNLDQPLNQALEEMDINLPTAVQAQAMPVIMKGKNTLCASETGSGKTLTYVIPIVQKALREKTKYGIKSFPGHPSVLVVLPSRELVSQVYSVTKKVTQHLQDFTIQTMQAGLDANHREILSHPTDLLIATPGTIRRCIRKNLLKLDCVRYLVLDEMDTLLDDSFIEWSKFIIHKVGIQTGAVTDQDGSDTVSISDGAQLILVGATLPKQFSQTLQDVLEGESLEIIATKNLHHVMPHVSQKFLRSGKEDRKVRIIEVLKKNAKRKIPTLVFTNSSKSCVWLSHFLRDNNIEAFGSLNSHMTPEERERTFARFLDGLLNILTCTDVGSRGLNTTRVQHVINFEVPNYMSDYIHRVGRVGRVDSSNATGHVLSYVVSPWDVEMVQDIEKSIRKGEQLPGVNANIKQQLQNLAKKRTKDDISELLGT